MEKIEISKIISIGKGGNKIVAIILIVLLLVIAALALINISKSIYTTTVKFGGLSAEETKNMLSDVMTILIITSLIGALILYLENNPKFSIAIILAAIVAVCKAIMIETFDAEKWLLYIGLGVLVVALGYTIKMLNNLLEKK